MLSGNFLSIYTPSYIIYHIIYNSRRFLLKYHESTFLLTISRHTSPTEIPESI